MTPEPEPRKMTADEFRLRVQVETALLSWVNTSLALMGFGFVVARFGLFLRELAAVGNVALHSHPRLAWVNTVTGVVLILLGVATLVLSVVSHRALMERLDHGDLGPPSRWSRGVVLSLILAAIGVGVAVYLATVEF
jgi:inner membrane protein YidH